MSRQFNGKVVSSTSSAEIVGYTHVKKKDILPLSPMIQQLSQNKSKT